MWSFSSRSVGCQPGCSQGKSTTDAEELASVWKVIRRVRRKTAEVTLLMELEWGRVAKQFTFRSDFKREDWYYP